MTTTREPMVASCAAYDRAGRRLPDITLDEISDALQSPDHFVWVGLCEPDETLLAKMQEEFGLHQLAVEDAQHAHQRPKLEVYGDSVFVALHTGQEIDGKIRFGETHAFLGRRYLLTVRHGASASYGGVRATCERNPEMLALGPSYALYAIADFVVDNFLPIIDAFRERLGRVEQEFLSGKFDQGSVQELYGLKKELLTLRMMILPMRDIFSQLAQNFPGLVHDDVRPYYRDVYDHSMRLKDACDTLSDTLSLAMSVNLSMTAITQGDVVKRLAGWAALLAAPTLIASWYGMNFEHMPELPGKYSYAIVTAVTAVICVILYRVLKRANWL